ncbi:hypothetical protein PPL_02352 [Heterostelium album PN500]|uniref:Uncharacterized protein n=1 Tax=Heterostelium pallidum (strain ATCC 26659 / Pp 5 / PN500) TaxID=670386 RepID=D3B225_HETP5|nr:hypothetical protein PPL_02352 [Heterostelium album PN500]EFA85349.1 hypothetical protein PPL_02352 [Heterostelium album PN500]|eukprot:XP_020437458.1 hypothetical protein PPL_02352 [Heterostelium album PN500]
MVEIPESEVKKNLAKECDRFFSQCLIGPSYKVSCERAKQECHKSKFAKICENKNAPEYQRENLCPKAPASGRRFVPSDPVTSSKYSEQTKVCRNEYDRCKKSSGYLSICRDARADCSKPFLKNECDSNRVPEYARDQLCSYL